jgi:transcription elongation GreA/GreB family factor
MSDDIKKQKVEMWSKKLFQLEGELKEIFVRKGEAARDGDLSENAAYKAAIEDAEAWQARIADVKKILTDLGVDPERLLAEQGGKK